MGANPATYDAMTIYRGSTFTRTFTYKDAEGAAIDLTDYAGEFKARARHSMLLHAGDVGFWNHDFSMLGASYRYHNSWMEFRIGYFYRIRSEGMQSSPLIGVGFVI